MTAQVFPFDEGDLQAKILVIVAVGLVAWWMLRPRFHVRIIVQRGQVLQMDGVPAAQRNRLAEFFQNDVSLDRRVTILGLRDRSGHLWLKFRGRINDAMQQRIRNFLTTTL